VALTYSVCVQAFIHLLSPAFKAFNSPCVARHWRHYVSGYRDHPCRY